MQGRGQRDSRWTQAPSPGFAPIILTYGLLRAPHTHITHSDTHAAVNIVLSLSQLPIIACSTLGTPFGTYAHWPRPRNPGICDVHWCCRYLPSAVK